MVSPTTRRVDHGEDAQMPYKQSVRPPGWYWIVSLLALLWMLVGLMALGMDYMLDEAALAAMPEGQRALYVERPQWVFIVYAVAIFSGLAGAIGLLLRRAWAVGALSLSVFAVVVQFGYVIFAMDAIERVGTAEALTMPGVILGLGVLFLWFASHARKRLWIA